VENKEEWVEVDVAATSEPPKVDAAPIVEPQEEVKKEPEESNFGKRAQKRIHQLVGNVKEREEVIARLEAELAEARKKAQGAESSAYGVYRKSQEERIKTAEKRYQAAYDAADRDELLKAQHELIEAKVEIRALDAWERNQKDQEAAPPPPPPKPGVHPTAAEWMSRNTWFGQGDGKDKVATMAAAAISEDLLREGYDANSQEYFEEIEARLVKEIPRMATKLGGREPETHKPVVAGQSRNPGRRIRLDEGTVKASQRLGASMEDTARYMEKIQEAGDGYVNIDIKRGRR